MGGAPPTAAVCLSGLGARAGEAVVRPGRPGLLGRAGGCSRGLCWPRPGPGCRGEQIAGEGGPRTQGDRPCRARRGAAVRCPGEPWSTRVHAQWALRGQCPLWSPGSFLADRPPRPRRYYRRLPAVGPTEAWWPAASLLIRRRGLLGVPRGESGPSEISPQSLRRLFAWAGRVGWRRGSVGQGVAAGTLRGSGRAGRGHGR